MSITSRDAQIAVNGAFAQAEAFVASNVQDFGPDDVAEVAEVVKALGTAFARNRLAVIAEITTEYPDAQPRKSGGGGNWGAKKTGGGGKAPSNPDAPVSDGQKRFISNLLEEKVYDGEVDFSALTMGQASSLIDTLKAAPDVS